MITKKKKKSILTQSGNNSGLRFEQRVNAHAENTSIGRLNYAIIEKRGHGRVMLTSIQSSKGYHGNDEWARSPLLESNTHSDKLQGASCAHCLASAQQPCMSANLHVAFTNHCCHFTNEDPSF